MRTSPQMQAKSINELLRTASGRIPKDEATYLMQWVLGVNGAWLYLHGDDPMDDVGAQRFIEAVDRREAGEPVAYIEGSRGFWKLDLEVSTDTLIPRPETELLVEAALLQLPEGQSLDVLDLGTGSGAIALSLAHERPELRVVAVERSAAALAVAIRNAKQSKISNIDFMHGSWYAPIGTQHFHCIVSNPPYIREDDPHLSLGDLRFEPRSALSSGRDGLDDIRLIVSQAPRHLIESGCLLIEHGFDQGEAVRDIFEKSGLASVETLRDLESRERVTQGIWQPK